MTVTRFGITILKRFKMASTIHDVAKLAHVSVGTVSRYLNGHRLRKENQERIEEAIHALEFRGNYVARSLRMRRTETVGVIVPTLKDPFVSAVVTGVERGMGAQGYNLLIADYANDPELVSQKIDNLISKMVDAIVLFPRALTEDFTLGGGQLPIPLVLVDEDLPRVSCDKVLLDNVHGSYEATNHLIRSGHRKIAIINGRRDSTVSLERYEGYRLAMKDAAIGVDQSLVDWGDFTTQGGYVAAKRLLSQQAPPTALIVTNYHMTLGTVMASYELNVRIPAFLSLIGFGNFELSDIARPPLTVIDQPIDEMSRAITELLLGRVRGGDSDGPRTLKMKPSLLMRESIREL